MSGVETIIAVVASLATVAATATSVVASNQAAKAEEELGANNARISQHVAKLQEEQAGQERAVAQRAMEDQRRQGRIVASRAQALSAASGGGALDPSIVNILGDIENESEFRAMTALYEGEERARSLESDAELSRATGQIYQSAGAARASALRTQGYNNILSGASSLYGIYSENQGAFGFGGSGGEKVRRLNKPLTASNFGYG